MLDASLNHRLVGSHRFQIMDSMSVAQEKDSHPQGPGDWVKELFAPIYDFDAIVAAGRDGYKLEDKKTMRVPILDPSSVREVFERVHQRVVEAEKKKLINDKKDKKEEEHDLKIDLRKSSIWNTEELESLRKVYKSAKDEITKLEVALKEQTAHSQALEAVVLKQKEEAGELKAKLADATKSNQRLVIHRDSLQKELTVLDVKVRALTDMWHDIEQEKVKAMEEAKAARIQLITSQMSLQRLEIEMAEVKQNLLQEIALAERILQTKYEMKMNDLLDVVKDLTVELKEEKKLHDASRRGLDHLRQHFASLPLQHLLPSDAVDKDVVVHIDHCSL